MSTALVRRDPREADRLALRAGLALKRCGEARALARATGLTPSTAYRWLGGERTGPAFDFLVFVTALSRDPATSPWPALVEARVTAMREMRMSEDIGQLICRYRVLQRRRVDARRRADLAALSGERTLERQQQRIIAETEMEMVAIDEILEAQGVDPRAGVWQDAQPGRAG